MLAITGKKTIKMTWTNQIFLFVRYNRGSVITEFVITEFVITEFDCSSYLLLLNKSFLFNLKKSKYLVDSLFSSSLLCIASSVFQMIDGIIVKPFSIALPLPSLFSKNHFFQKFWTNCFLFSFGTKISSNFSWIPFCKIA